MAVSQAAELLERFGLAEKRADYPDRLSGGQIVEQAPPARLFSEPSDERTRRFLRRIIERGACEARG